MDYLMPEYKNVQLYQMPDLPKIVFKANKVEYTVTDLRFLNENAVYCFEQILNEICSDPNCEEVSFNVNGIDYDKVNLITDIVGGIMFECKKGGKNGFWLGGRFVTGGQYMETDDEKIYTFHLAKDVARSIYEYAKGKDKVNYYELVMAVANGSRKHNAEKDVKS